MHIPKPTLLVSLLLLLLTSSTPTTASAGCTLACDDYLVDLANAYNLEPNVEDTSKPISQKDVSWLCGDGVVLDCYCCQGDGLTQKQYDFFIWWATVCATAQVNGNAAGAECWNGGFADGECITKINC